MVVLRVFVRYVFRNIAMSFFMSLCVSLVCCFMYTCMSFFTFFHYVFMYVFRSLVVPFRMCVCVSSRMYVVSSVVRDACRASVLSVCRPGLRYLCVRSPVSLFVMS